MLIEAIGSNWSAKAGRREKWPYPRWRGLHWITIFCSAVCQPCLPCRSRPHRSLPNCRLEAVRTALLHPSRGTPAGDFFVKDADTIESESTKAAEELRRVNLHWMRHTHATHAFAQVAELTTARDSLSFRQFDMPSSCRLVGSTCAVRQTLHS